MKMYDQSRAEIVHEKCDMNMIYCIEEVYSAEPDRVVVKVLSTKIYFGAA